MVWSDSNLWRTTRRVQRIRRNQSIKNPRMIGLKFTENGSCGINITIKLAPLLKTKICHPLSVRHSTLSYNLQSKVRFRIPHLFGSFSVSSKRELLLDFLRWNTKESWAKSFKKLHIKDLFGAIKVILWSTPPLIESNLAVRPSSTKSMRDPKS